MRKYSVTDALIEEFTSRTLAELQVVLPEARYLEIGSGELHYRRFLNEHRWECVFSDIEFRSEGVSVLADAERLPFADNTFDVIAMLEVLEHIPNINRALAEISRVLRIGGYFVVTFPFNYSLHELPYDFRRWTEFNAWQQFEAARLKPKKFERRGNAIGVILTIGTHLMLGAAEAMRRIHVLRPLASIVTRLTELTVRMLSVLYVWRHTQRGTSINLRPGENLKGMRGHLQLWHLGYQFVCQKV